MTNEPVKLIVRTDDPVEMVAAGSLPVRWASHEYIPVSGVDAPTYTGPYEVVPAAFEGQVLDTNGKLMRNDVLVHEIPYLETSNDSGGVTVSIAS